ncbi:hypothetical protein ACFVJW_07045 [Streptomyces libani]|uniref:hypothetical protein n=1 Tax=Streptomyces nigrescens TaxID=1920 RepID=UPI00362F6A2E
MGRLREGEDIPAAADRIEPEQRLEVPASSSKTIGSSIPASSRTRFCRAVDCWSVETRL